MKQVMGLGDTFWRSVAATDHILPSLSSNTIDDGTFRLLGDNIPTLCWIANGDGYIVWYNRRWHDYCGTTPEQMEGWGWQSVHDPELLPLVVERWTQSITSGDPFEMTFPLRGADGVFRQFLTRIQPVRDASGQIARWFGINTEISDHISTQQRLVESNNRFKAAVEAVQGVLWTNTAEGEMRGEQSGWSSLTGQIFDEYQGVGWADAVHPDDAQPTIDAWALAVKERKPYVFEHRVRRRDGAWRLFSIRAIPALRADNSIREWVGVHTDITDQRLAEDKLRELNEDLEQRVAQAILERQKIEEQLRQSQKMEAIGQLTGGIAHDFNNMLAVVIGSLDLLGRRGSINDVRQQRYIDSAADAARRAATLTQRLLAFSRQQPLKPEIVDPNKLVSGMSDLLRRSLGETVQLEAVLAGGLWRVHVDPPQLESALLNLAVNARDAMSEGGRMTVETQNTYLDERYAAEHLGVPAGQYVLIAVSDTGAGMTSDVIAKAFDPFYTTKSVGKGTGLGLSQVYGFVKQSGGHVKIYSEPGQGTVVKIYLPRFSGEDDRPPENDSRAGNLEGVSQEVILVVEDEPSVRQFSVDALTELGYRVLEADGARAALKLLDMHAEIVLLFTDVVMPEMNGAHLAREARLRRPGIKVLFTTGYTRNAVVHNGVLDVGVELLGKPYSIDALAAKVRQVLDVVPPISS